MEWDGRRRNGWEAARKGENGGDGMHNIFSSISTGSPPPFKPQIFASNFAGAHPRRPIEGQEVFRASEGSLTASCIV